MINDDSSVNLSFERGAESMESAGYLVGGGCIGALTLCGTILEIFGDAAQHFIWLFAIIGFAAGFAAFYRIRFNQK